MARSRSWWNGASVSLLLGVAVVFTSTTSAVGATNDDAGIDEVIEASTLSNDFAGGDVQADSIQGNVATVAGQDSSVAIVLPVAEEASVTVSRELISLSEEPSFSIVPVVLEDGSVAIHSVLHDSSSPTTFDYEFKLSEGAVLELDEHSGGAIGFNADGSPAVFVAPPWARDANGESVTTSYTVQGHTLTQHVEVDADTEFPVVADPWAGVDLVASHTVTWATESSGSGWKVNVNPTAWARGYTGHPLWTAIGAAGWDELRNKMTATNRAKLNNSGRDQYICHMGFAGFDAQWNMELWKPSKSLASWVASLCN